MLTWRAACLSCAGVEHLLRDVKDATISTLASDVSAKLQALKGLKSRLADVQVRPCCCWQSGGSCLPAGASTQHARKDAAVPGLSTVLGVWC